MANAARRDQSILVGRGTRQKQTPREAACPERSVSARGWVLARLSAGQSLIVGGFMHSWCGPVPAGDHASENPCRRSETDARALVA